MTVSAAPARPRVALVSNLSPHYRRPLYETLAERFELDCYFFAEDEPYWNSRLQANVPGAFRQVPLRRVTLLGEPILPGLARRLDAERYDAVVVGLTGRLMVPFVYAVARVRGVPFVLWTGVWQHPGTFFHRLTRPVVEELYRRADAIVVYGEHVRRALLAVAGVADQKIFTAAQAVDGGAFDVGGDPGGSRTVLFVGQFEDHKGIRQLVRAFGRVEDDTLRLELVGSGSLQPLLQRAAEEDARISVVGHVSQEELPVHLANARCLVLPSVTTRTHKEAWGLVVNEAMHARLPVIVTDAVGAAADGLVTDSDTGLVVPEDDVPALANALRRIAGDDELVRRLGERAKQKVGRYTFAAMGDAFEAAVAHARRRRGGG